MKRVAFLLSVLGTCALVSCTRDKTPLGPVERAGLCPQQEIPWPSIADSPWPVMGADPQGTHRGRYPGPRAGRVVWSLVLCGWSWPPLGVVVGGDGTIYLTTDCPTTKETRLYAIAPDGTVMWSRHLCDECYGSSATVLLADGRVLVLAWRYGIEFASDGTELSRYQIEGANRTTKPGVGPDGTLYIVAYYYPFPALAVQRGGNLLWTNSETQFTLGEWNEGWWVSMSPAGDVVYLMTTGSASPGSLVALDAHTGTRLWEAPASWDSCYPVVDSEGNLYYSRLREEIGYVLCSVTDQGVLRWEGDYPVLPGANLALGVDGSLYVRGEKDELLCFDCAGHLKWRVPVLSGLGRHGGEVVVDCEGTCYLVYPNRFVSAFDRSGHRMFTCELPERGIGLTGAAISAEGRLYVLGERGLYCIE
ncbi:MAG: PQQ-binding-like beta-propeller repeat protein [Calditrichaeota bacterium]|nr:PQQ-binding-like beta-propeller repeat protein [Calditrichota bacterium]